MDSEGEGNLLGTTNNQLPSPHIDLPLTLKIYFFGAPVFAAPGPVPTSEKPSVSRAAVVMHTCVASSDFYVRTLSKYAPSPT